MQTKHSQILRGGKGRNVVSSPWPQPQNHLGFSSEWQGRNKRTTGNFSVTCMPFVYMFRTAYACVYFPPYMRTLRSHSMRYRIWSLVMPARTLSCDHSCIATFYDVCTLNSPLILRFFFNCKYSY